MTTSEKLKHLLEREILPDVEAAIDELFAMIDKAKSASTAQKEELEELREMRAECYAIVEDLQRDEIDAEEIEALFEELMELKTQQDSD
jgi:cob(I)alamin adenosyltransferase